MLTSFYQATLLGFISTPNIMKVFVCFDYFVSWECPFQRSLAIGVVDWCG